MTHKALGGFLKWKLRSERAEIQLVRAIMKESRAFDEDGEPTRKRPRLEFFPEEGALASRQYVEDRIRDLLRAAWFLMTEAKAHTIIQLVFWENRGNRQFLERLIAYADSQLAEHEELLRLESSSSSGRSNQDLNADPDAGAKSAHLPHLPL